MTLRQVHIAPFDLRGESAYVVRVPYHAGFVEAIKVLISPQDRSFSMMRCWFIKAGQIDRLHSILNVMFFPEEFCSKCWTQKPCIEWQIEFPRVEGTLLEWPQPKPHPPVEKVTPRVKAIKPPRTSTPSEAPKVKEKKPRKKKEKPAVQPPPPEPVPPPKQAKVATPPPPPKEEVVPPQQKPRVEPPPPPQEKPPRPGPPPGVVKRSEMTLARAEKILGLAFGYSADDVRSAFRKKALETHPDRPGGSTEKFLQVKEASDFMLKVMKPL
jgi:hypothetical protein